MSKTYFGIGPSIAWMQRKYPPIKVQNLTTEEFKARIGQGVEAILHSGHRPVVSALKSRFGIDIPIPNQPTEVDLQFGDVYLTVYFTELPQLDQSRDEYTVAELERVEFQFTEFRFEPPQTFESILDDMQNDIADFFSSVERQAEEIRRGNKHIANEDPSVLEDVIKSVNKNSY